jgi:hypothetical protein
VSRHGPHWLAPERQRWVPQQPLLPAVHALPCERQHDSGPPPSAWRVSQLIEQQSSPLAQVVLVGWQVAWWHRLSMGLHTSGCWHSEVVAQLSPSWPGRHCPVASQRRLVQHSLVCEHG